MRRRIFTLAVLVGSIVAPFASSSAALAQQVPDPAAGAKAVQQQLVVEVPEHAPPPVSITVGQTGSAPVPATPAGTLPRTGVGPWFGPTLALALVLLAVGVGLRAIARRLAGQRMAWPQYGQLA